MVLELFLLFQAAFSQKQGSIKVESVHAKDSNTRTTVTATAGTVICTFQNIDLGTVRVSCGVSGKGAFLQELHPEFKGKPTTGSYVANADMVEWTLEMKTVGVTSFMITANGYTRGGNF